MANISLAQARQLAQQRHLAGELEAAIPLYRQVLDKCPDDAAVWNNLGVALQTCRQLEEAEAAFRRALTLRPAYLDALGNLGECVRLQGRWGEAIETLVRATEAFGGTAVLYYNLGTAYDDAHQFDLAIRAYKRAVELLPNAYLPHVNLGASLMAVHRYDEAMASLQRAIQLAPQNAMAYNNAGTCCLTTGRTSPAIEYYRAAATRGAPICLAHLSNLLLALHYRPRIDAQELCREHRRFGELVAGLPKMPDSSGNRLGHRLRIGYVSPDFRRHSVAFFLEPILESHDRGAFEIFCYSDVAWEDEVTLRLRAHADRWIDSHLFNDEELAKCIFEDQIDVLVDLAGHTSGNRMGVFARKAAAVQFSYLGYPNTTGLAEIDYRITDDVADRPGIGDDLHTEKLWRLPRSMWCYKPTPDCPQVASNPPCLANGYITFGSFNAVTKLNPPLALAWANILNHVPRSRLLIKAAAMRDAGTRERTLRLFREAGLEESRVDLQKPIDDHLQHLSVYNRIDISLDTFPYCGTTTTCDALWMGVPVVTLAGETHVARVGASLLSAVGLHDWVTESTDDYVARGVHAAADHSQLADLRKCLREKVAASPLRDAIGLTQTLEQAYRQGWERRFTPSKQNRR